MKKHGYGYMNSKDAISRRLMLEEKAMKISEMQKQAYENAVAHGWHDQERTFGELIALCHSELSEALEEFRTGENISINHYPCKAPIHTPIHCQRFESASCSGCEYAKPEGIPSELADVVIRVADMCGQYGIDLEAAIIEKMKYNQSRPYKHGGKTI